MGEPRCIAEIRKASAKRRVYLYSQTGDPIANIVDVVEAYDIAIQRAETAEKALRHEAAERKKLQEWQNETQEREAACCPEDIGFDEYIATLTRELADTKAREAKILAVLKADPDSMVAECCKVFECLKDEMADKRELLHRIETSDALTLNAQLLHSDQEVYRLTRDLAAVQEERDNLKAASAIGMEIQRRTSIALAAARAALLHEVTYGAKCNGNNRYVAGRPDTLCAEGSPCACRDEVQALIDAARTAREGVV